MNFIDFATIAWRNLLRSKRRTFLTAATVAFGVLLSVSFTAMGDYSYTNMINSSATMGLGHITISAKGFNENPNLTKYINADDKLQEVLAATPEVEAFYVRISGQAIFASGAKTSGGQFMAIDPNREKSDHNFFLQYIDEGGLFSDSEPGGVVVGAKMAEKLNLRLGKKLIYTLTDKNGEIVSAVSKVCGIFKSGENSIDSSIVLFHIDKMRRTLDYDKNDASLVALFIKDQRYAAETAKEISRNLPDLGMEVLTYKTTQAELSGLIAMDRASNYFMQFLIGLLIAAGILNTILMNVMERTREFGMMMAIGLSPWQIMKMVLMESFCIGLLGLIIGVILTTPLYIYMSNIGINLSNQIGEDYSAAGILVDPVLKFRLFKESVGFIMAGIFSLTMVAGLYPAYRAGRITPVDSLKAL